MYTIYIYMYIHVCICIGIYIFALELSMRFNQCRVRARPSQGRVSSCTRILHVLLLHTPMYVYKYINKILGIWYMYQVIYCGNAGDLN